MISTTSPSPAPGLTAIGLLPSLRLFLGKLPLTSLQPHPAWHLRLLAFQATFSWLKTFLSWLLGCYPYLSSSYLPVLHLSSHLPSLLFILNLGLLFPCLNTLKMSASPWFLLRSFSFLKLYLDCMLNHLTGHPSGWPHISFWYSSFQDTVDFQIPNISILIWTVAPELSTFWTELLSLHTCSSASPPGLYKCPHHPSHHVYNLLP